MSVSRETNKIFTQSGVSRETSRQLTDFVELLIDENSRQNLISKASEISIWERHIDDSLQLLEHASADGNWLDIGSGPGLPGMVLAIAGVKQITLVEPRRLRTEFLERCRERLKLDGVQVVTGKASDLSGKFDVITARAVAPIDKLFAMAEPLMAPNGRWVLPKGRSAQKELEEARATWQGDFRLISSRTDPDAKILIAENVRQRTGRR